MVALLHAMALVLLLVIGWVIWNNKPLPLCNHTHQVDEHTWCTRKQHFQL